jgi:hypothetical protein
MENTFETLVAKLANAVESGVVWNADLEDLKSRLNSMVWKERGGLVQVWLNARPAGKYEFENEATESLYWNAPSTVHDVKSWSKRVAKWAPKGNLPVGAQAFVDRWLPVAQLFDQAKPIIRKGRKPSETPRATQERTLENTGTCPVCSANVKRSADGTLVRHGYEVQYGSFVGDCFGVGFQPFELTPNGAEKFLEALTFRRDQLENRKAEVERGDVVVTVKVADRKSKLGFRFENVNPGDANYAGARSATLRELDSELRQVESYVQHFAQKIQGWKLATLPGIKAGFQK